MSGITNIQLGPKYAQKVSMLDDLAKTYPVDERLNVVPSDFLLGLNDLSLGELDTKVRSGGSLSIKEAFQGMLLVIAATNNVLRPKLFQDLTFETAVAKGTYFLTMLAAKEHYIGLTAEEIAGISGAGQLDILHTPDVISVVEMAGMGADRGWGTKAIKTINASTLAAFVMASLGYETFKHGSYGNTTRVGSTDVPEQFGANSAFNGGSAKIASIIEKTGFWFSDAHAVKTLHYLSHLLRVETVNHIVGPMTPPVGYSSKLHKVIGVNQYVHPKTMAEAYFLLNQLGFVSLGSAVVVAGIDSLPIGDQQTDPRWFREHGYLDEVSPRYSLLALALPNVGVEVRILDTKRDLGLSICEDDIKVPNTIPTLMRANTQALQGGIFAEYLAANVAIALLSVHNETTDLRDFVFRALANISEGKAMEKVAEYAKATGGTFKSW